MQTLQEKSFSYKTLLLYGFTTYMTVFAYWTLLVSYRLDLIPLRIFVAIVDGPAPQWILTFVPTAVSIIVVAVVMYLAGRMIHTKHQQHPFGLGGPTSKFPLSLSLRIILPYAFGWALIHFVLDVLFVIPASGFASIFTPAIFLGYAVVFIAPIVAVLTQSFLNRNSQVA